MARDNLSIKFRRQYKLEESPEVLLSKFKNALNNKSSAISGNVVQDNLFLKISRNERHYWSPEMTITFEKEETGTYVREVIGPNSGIYTFTMFLFFFTGTLLLFALMFLFSQITLNMPTSTTWIIIAISLLGLIFVFLFMLGGRIKAKPQMIILREFAEKVFKSD